jgi:hypothetical protein
MSVLHQVASRGWPIAVLIRTIVIILMHRTETP